jgi:hypothetical protein
MKILYKGLLLALLQIGIVSSLGAKLLYDRAHRPRVWIKSAIYDPNLPIRGKYLALNIEVPAEGFSGRVQNLPYGPGSNPYEFFSPNRCDLILRGNQLIAVANQQGEFWANVSRRNQDLVVVISGEMAYFLPEHKDGPILRNPGEELWIEATIPRKGPPRPLRLGIKKDGVLTPLPAE